MKTHEIAIDRLQPHPLNSNVMPERLFDKLVDHIERTGRYPALIVRPQGGGVYQVLDGHHRLRTLQQLGHTQARCDVWPVNEAEATTLLATLNRLEGKDDARRRARLLAALERQLGSDDARSRLPERGEQVQKLLKLNEAGGPPTPPPRLEDMPVAVHFFLLPAQRTRLNRRLRELGGTREDALMRLIEHPSGTTHDQTHESQPDHPLATEAADP